MSIRFLLPASILLLSLAAGWYLPTAIRQSTPESSSTAVVANNQTQTSTAPVSYSALKAHVRETIDSTDEATAQWYERNARHLGKSAAGRDVRQRVQSLMRQEDEMMARWKATLRKMTEGEYTHAQAVVESRKIDAEGEAFMADLRLVVRDMQRIQGCHCGG